jgi:hypothetical protein
MSRRQLWLHHAVLAVYTKRYPVEHQGLVHRGITFGRCSISRGTDFISATVIRARVLDMSAETSKTLICPYVLRHDLCLWRWS